MQNAEKSARIVTLMEQMPVHQQMYFAAYVVGRAEELQRQNKRVFPLNFMLEAAEAFTRSQTPIS